MELSEEMSPDELMAFSDEMANDESSPQSDVSFTLFPVRCYTCGKVLGNLQRRYDMMIDSGKSVKDALDELGIVRPCCRTRSMSPITIYKNRNTPIGGLGEGLKDLESSVKELTLDDVEFEEISDFKPTGRLYLAR